MKTAYVIKCNDIVKGVVIDDAIRANNITNKLQKEDYEKVIAEYGNFEHYHSIFFWHIREVPVL